MSWLKKKRNKLFVGATLLAAAVAVLNSINRQEEIVEQKIREQKIILQTTTTSRHTPSPTPDVLKKLAGEKKELITAEKVAEEIISELRVNLSIHNLNWKYSDEDSLIKWVISRSLPKDSENRSMNAGLDFSEKELRIFISKLDKTIKAYINRLDILHREREPNAFSDNVGSTYNLFDTLAGSKWEPAPDGVDDYKELIADSEILDEIVKATTNYKTYQDKLRKKYMDGYSSIEITYNQAKEILYNCLLGLIEGLLNGTRNLLEEENKLFELNNRLLSFSEEFNKKYNEDIDKINVLNEAINENIEILEKTITEIEKFRKGLLKEMQKRGYKKLF
ncbi:MAG TPA: hypothetical protein HA226_03115 [Nanoarchaeota archaeon]|nr:MAG: hypothetical protein QT09_C0012G0017 [archaeon GW2011_AR18]HIH25736.1 hypothetical protein [Nanoarchaeota archaeon]